MDRAGMADQERHTLDGGSRPDLPRYDLQAAALIIVTMKVMFGLDDHTEWDLSNKTGSHDDTGDLFSFRKWYKLVQAAFMKAQQRRNQDIARKQWKGQKLFFTDKRDRLFMTKKRRISENVQMCLKRLSSCPEAGQEDSGPSSFQFCWGDEYGSDGPSLHHTKTCISHYPSIEPTLPRSFVWLLQLFSFMLDVEAWYLFDEVLEVERRIFGIKTPQIGQQLETRKWLRTEKTSTT
ncbi:hypothetical protein CCH79_00018496 [Gambusia affinis]|uniref:Rrn7/TAF1B C-terminal cyclin domain-containing protein n=1 Tax=Gambusia affinis TaxID=33528 RepID=A0A315UR97_GAMAF|nr:hypothetical protein CCH79_00018496 [Gambusia affinis]